MKLSFDDEKKWGIVKDNLTSVLKCYDKEGIEVILAIYPYAFSSRNLGLNEVRNYPYDQYHRRLTEFGNVVGFKVVDFLDYFRQEHIQSLDDYIVDGDGHPNGAFNGFVARHLTRNLVEWSLL